MDKEIVFGKDVREQLLSGVNKLTDAAVSTLGPSGRNVLIEQEAGVPVITKDGVTVAKAVVLKDPVENMGAVLVKQASIKTADMAGDGTTTSTLLAREMYKAGLKQVLDRKANAVEIKRDMDLAVKEVVQYLKSYSQNITEEEQLRQVATVSANNDSEIGELIATAMDKMGRDGIVTVEESRTGETYLETVEGMQFDRGYKSMYFVTDNNSMQAVLDQPLILLTDKKIQQAKEILPILEACSSQNKALLIVADDIDGEALSTLIVNKMRGILKVAAVKAPDFGDKKKAILEDLAILTGGQVVSSEKGMRLDKFDTTWLGKAAKVTVSKDTTTIIDATGDETAISERIDQIKNQIDLATSPYEKESLQDRLGKFIGGVAILHVGGTTEVEMKEKKDRVDDALHATKAALEEGILPGGGIALLSASTYFSTDPNPSTGRRIVLEALKQPFNQILRNAGKSEEEVLDIRFSIPLEKEAWKGYDSRTETVVDMLECGIIDPTKVTRLALENAVSVAGTMLTTEAAVLKLRDEKKTGDVDPSMFM